MQSFRVSHVNPIQMTVLTKPFFMESFIRHSTDLSYKQLVCVIFNYVMEIQPALSKSENKQLFIGLQFN